jgi:UDP-N-acetylglucosamine--N-acetylmuramyl-(pentapeptide) pyrophosphoryl-undecaprenol N-acetylglucosamine transferase
VLVPYAVGNGEQRFNARDMVAAGGAVLVDDAAFSTAWVTSTLVPLIADRPRVARMAAAAASAGIRDGSARTADLVIEAVS